MSAELDATLPYDSLAQLRSAMIKDVPHLKNVDQVVENEWQPLDLDSMGDATFRTAVKEFYLTNPITRASALMAELAANAKARKDQPMAAE